MTFLYKDSPFYLNKVYFNLLKTKLYIQYLKPFRVLKRSEIFATVATFISENVPAIYFLLLFFSISILFYSHFLRCIGGLG